MQLFGGNSLGLAQALGSIALAQRETWKQPWVNIQANILQANHNCLEDKIKCEMVSE